MLANDGNNIPLVISDDLTISNMKGMMKEFYL